MNISVNISGVNGDIHKIQRVGNGDIHKVQRVGNKEIVTNLVRGITSGINSSLIKKNARIIELKYEHIKKIWLSLNGLQYNYEHLKKSEINHIINSHTLLKFNYYRHYISDDNINIIKLQYKNIIFYYVNKDNNFERDKEIINRLFKETIT